MPTNTSSEEQPDKSVDKPTAWACTLANLLAAPGLGSIAAGRKIGYVQMTLAVIGLILSVVGVVSVWREWSSGGFEEGLPRSFWIAVLGVALFMVAWFWALLTSLRLHGETKHSDTAKQNEK
ncbi:MAG: hypothetical protein ACP5MD_13915 [Verrucomicrobiia bacterium]